MTVYASGTVDAPSSSAGRLALAPMEGLADDLLRDILTAGGDYDWCVTEFVRVSATRLPHRLFTRLSPELCHGSRTAAGTPVRVQLLGSDPGLLAANAAHLAELHPAAIDLNFGCPVPLVNRHRGGAALLGEPELLHHIAAAVRAAVPAVIPVTAKMRLGIRDTAHTLDCARALEAGGIAELTVHARTREDGYRPPARWEWVAAIRDAVRLPLVANGEVWTTDDVTAIRRVTGCADVMLGRGAVADPLLARRTREGVNEAARDLAADWASLRPLLAAYWDRVQQRVRPDQSPGRVKQWLGLLRRRYPGAERLWTAVRECRHATELAPRLQAHGIG